MGQSVAFPTPDPEVLVRPSGPTVSVSYSYSESNTQCVKCHERTVVVYLGEESSNMCDACRPLDLPHPVPGEPNLRACDSEGVASLLSSACDAAQHPTTSCLSVFDSNTLYIRCDIVSESLLLCVDTGSAISIINTSVWNSLCRSFARDLPALSPVSLSVSSVSGSSVPVLGSVDLIVSLGEGFQTTHRFIVADIEPLGILWVRFFCVLIIVLSV